MAHTRGTEPEENARKLYLTIFVWFSAIETGQRAIGHQA